MSGSDVPHHAENREQKRIGIFIAILAVIMAVIGALQDNEAYHMIVKEVKSSNGFAWYQAKRQRSYMNELELKRIDVDLSGAPTDAQRKLLEDARAKLKAKNAEYEKENEEIRTTAEADERDAELAAHRHHGFEYGEIMLHIAIVLCSLTLLTELKIFFRLGVAATAGGVVLALWTLLLQPHEKPQSPAAPPAASANH